jgi:hypothetical protein
LCFFKASKIGIRGKVDAILIEVYLWIVIVDWGAQKRRAIERLKQRRVGEENLAANITGVTRIKMSPRRLHGRTASKMAPEYGKWWGWRFAVLGGQ